MASKQRICWVDFGKGRAIFLVVLGHVFLGLYQSGRFHSSEYWLWILIEGIYIFHMPVFFALSGYFFKPVETLASYVGFILKKTVQLGIPYILYNVIHFVLQQIGGGAVRDKASFVDLIHIYKSPLSVSWFLYILWGIFVVLGLLSLLIKDKKVMFGITLMMLVLVSLFPNNLMIIQRVGLWAPVFMLGSLLRDISLKDNKSRLLILAVVIAAYLIAWYNFDFENRISYSNPGLWGIIFYISVIFAFMLFSIFPKGKCFDYFTKYGRDSLVIYILHVPIVSVSRIVLLKVGVTNVILHILIGLSAGWLGSIFILYLTKVIPYIDFVFYPTKYLKK